MARKTGLILGKFLPPHKGHAYLIDFARRYPDINKLYVVVDRIKDEPIKQSLRVKWLQEMFPDVSVIPLGDYNYQCPEEAPSAEIFWQQWKQSLEAVLPEPVDYCFNSEQYGWKLSEVLGATHVPVDRGRSNFPISGTSVRSNPFSYWDFIPDAVRPYFTKRIAIVGAESTGKSVLSEKLSKYFNTINVPEYARIFLESLAEKDQPRATQLNDIPIFADGQMASESALTAKANRIMICDTEAITTSIWSEILYDTVPESVKTLANKSDYDLYIVASPDTKWVPDIHRQWEDLSKDARRQSFHHRILSELMKREKNYVVISGEDYDDRFEQAKSAIIDHVFQGKIFPDFGQP